MSEYVFRLPDLGEGTVESEIAEWLVKVGDTVHEEDPICAMLTDKAAVELSSPVTGRVVKLAGEVGDTIAVGTPLVTFETEEVSSGASAPAGGDRPRDKEQEPGPPSRSAPAPVPQADEPDGLPGGKVRTSPSIRRRASEAGIDLSRVPGSGPRGRVLKADFEAYVESRTVAGETARPGRKRGSATGATEVKVVGLRRKIAERMDRANREIPHFAYVEEVDVTALESLRRHMNARLVSGEPDYSLLPFIALALVRGLAEFPQCNAHYDADRNVIVRHDAVHLGIATQTADGLKVPVVRHAEGRSLADLAAEIRRVATAARDNTAKREELSGSTITLTSLGKLGGIASTPIINLPEVAVIGVNRALERPVVEDGHVVIRTMMNLSSSFDHRFVDGYDAAAMIQAVKQLLEQPATIFI